MRKLLDRSGAGDGDAGDGGFKGTTAPGSLDWDTAKCAALKEPLAVAACKAGGALINFFSTFDGKWSHPAALSAQYNQVNQALNGPCVAQAPVRQSRPVTVAGLRTTRAVGEAHMQTRHLVGNGSANWKDPHPDKRVLCIGYANGCSPFRGCHGPFFQWRKCKPGSRAIDSREWNNAPPLSHEARAQPRPFERGDFGTSPNRICPKCQTRVFESEGKTCKDWNRLSKTDASKLPAPSNIPYVPDSPAEVDPSTRVAGGATGGGVASSATFTVL